MDGFVVGVRLPGAHALTFSVSNFDCSLKESSRCKEAYGTLVEGGVGGCFFVVSLMEKRTKPMHVHFSRISLEIEVCTRMCEANSVSTSGS